MPTHTDSGHHSFMSPVELRPIVDSAVSCRVDTGGFDVVMEGMSDGPEDLNQICPDYGEAGLTQWDRKAGMVETGWVATFDWVLKSRCGAWQPHLRYSTDWSDVADSAVLAAGHTLGPRGARLQEACRQDRTAFSSSGQLSITLP
jgi:hypothetical protein